MYRMAVLSMLCDDRSLDVSKLVERPLLRFSTANRSMSLRCVMMALVHDLAEAQGEERLIFMPISHIFTHFFYLKVGDIAPREGIPKAEKHRLESVKRTHCILQLNLTHLTFFSTGGYAQFCP